MAKYAATCTQWPELTIGANIHFSSGSFETDDPDVWAELQRNAAWGIQIHPRDVMPSADAGAAPAETPPEGPEYEESSEPRVRRGGRGSR